MISRMMSIRGDISFGDNVLLQLELVLQSIKWVHNNVERQLCIPNLGLHFHHRPLRSQKSRQTTNLPRSGPAPNHRIASAQRKTAAVTLWTECWASDPVVRGMSGVTQSLCLLVLVGLVGLGLSVPTSSWLGGVREVSGIYRSSSDAAGDPVGPKSYGWLGEWYQMEHRDGLVAGLTWLLVDRRGGYHIDHC